MGLLSWKWIQGVFLDGGACIRIRLVLEMCLGKPETLPCIALVNERGLGKYSFGLLVAFAGHLSILQYLESC